MLVRVAGNNVADVEIVDIVAGAGILVTSSLDAPGKALSLTLTASESDAAAAVALALHEADTTAVHGITDTAGLAPKASPTFTGMTTIGAITVTDANDVILGTTNGTKIGTAAAQKVAFHDAVPVIQRAGAAQAAVTTTVGAAVAATAATNVAPYGYAQAQADAIVTNINTLRVDVLALTVLVNELRAALVAKGLVKGAA